MISYELHALHSSILLKELTWRVNENDLLHKLVALLFGEKHSAERTKGGTQYKSVYWVARSSAPVRVRTSACIKSGRLTVLAQTRSGLARCRKNFQTGHNCT
jgi:hypothetical protein